jgi:hypothetical protein
MLNTPKIQHLEAQLNDFNPVARAQALEELLYLVERNTVTLPETRQVANMHCHTFYSFNAFGYSPTALAWLGRKQGIAAMGIVDFDVLDAVDEFLLACDKAGVRGSAGMETRVFIPEFAAREINSPGEPGISYHMGIGFTSSQVPAGVTKILLDLRQRAEQRNRAMLARLNPHLAPVTVDYTADVLPLTPNSNATERHMLAAFVQAALEQSADPDAFWAEKLGTGREQVAALGNTSPAFQNLVRSKLMKRGGIGYVQPDAGSFPKVEEVHQLIEAAQALPTITWLDGTSAGEQAMPELAELLIEKGAVALNIVPDRNWNIADPEIRQRKVANLYQVVELAEKYDLPVNVGTEMNAHGNKLVDDFDAPELAPVRQVFMDGAYFIYGQTFLQRALGLGYQSDWVKKHLPGRAQRKDYFTRLGRQVEPGAASLERAKKLSPALDPAVLFVELTKSR